MKPPMICILCGSLGEFSSEEHIVPHSLGNDIIVLAPGWLCDACNNVCSAFESRVLSGSILGLERCRLGVVTKKRKPARASLHGVTWFAEPATKSNVVSAIAEWEKIPILWREHGAGTLAVLLHDKTNLDIARLLLKMGIELLAVRNLHKTNDDHGAAKKVVLGKDALPWPYFILRDKRSLTRSRSVFEATPDAREYIQGLGFDLYMHEVESNEILFFQYGNFFAAISVTSRSTNWISVLKKWETSYVGCPVEFFALIRLTIHPICESITLNLKLSFGSIASILP